MGLTMILSYTPCNQKHKMIDKAGILSALSETKAEQRSPNATTQLNAPLQQICPNDVDPPDHGAGSLLVLDEVQPSAPVLFVVGTEFGVP